MKRERVPERAQRPSLRLEGLINQLLRTLPAPASGVPGPRCTKMLSGPTPPKRLKDVDPSVLTVEEHLS